MEGPEPQLAKSDFSRGSWEFIFKSCTLVIIKCWQLIENMLEHRVTPPTLLVGVLCNVNGAVAEHGLEIPQKVKDRVIM